MAETTVFQPRNMGVAKIAARHFVSSTPLNLKSWIRPCVDTFNWKELSPTSPHHGPMMKSYCGMVAVQLEGEAYLVVIGGSNYKGQQPGTQRDAQYESNDIYSQYCNEIHYYKLSSGQYN